MRSLRTRLWIIRIVVLALVVALIFGQTGPVLAAAQRIREDGAAHQPNPNCGLKKGLYQALTPAMQKKINARAKATTAKPVQDVRSLTLSEMRSAYGSGVYRNPYFDGTMPWQRSFRDANLCTGNLFKSFTDIQVSNARGAGLAFQRTYNSNDARIGPFGLGWTHAYDIRMQEADQVQSESGNSSVDDTVNDVPRTDFFGGKHVYHRDADGLYTPPSYLFDTTSSDYNNVITTSGPPESLDDTEIGMDGTVKHYVLNGSERDISYIEDRHGNKTTFTYDQSTTLPDGRHPLITVTDPTGRELAFTWANIGTVSQPAWRITQAQGPLTASGAAVSGVTVTVQYAYYTNTSDPNAANNLYNLQSVTIDPSGLDRVTSYTYTGITGANGTENGLLASITDPIGLVTSYTYSLSYQDPDNNTISTPTGTVWVSSVTEPAGVDSSGNPRTITWGIGYYDSTPAGPGWIVEVYSPPSSPTNIFPVTANIAIFLVFDDNLRVVRWGDPWVNTRREYTSMYDNSNNVTQQWSDCVGGDWYRIDEYSYGPNGNVLTHNVEGYPGTETTTWDNQPQYFQKASETDMEGHLTSYTVGSSADPNIGNRGEVLAIKDPGYNDPSSPSYQKQYTYTYNPYGQKASETNLNGVVTNYTYGDQWGNLTQVQQDPSGLNRTTTMTYDIAGHVLTSSDPNGNETITQYNVVGQLTQVQSYNNSDVLQETISYSYDADGRTTGVTDHRGTTTIVYVPNSATEVQSATDPVTGTTSYTYELTGERASMTLPGGGSWTYGYVEDLQSPFTSGGYVVAPKDDPNSVQMALTSITDDQGRKTYYNIWQSGQPRQLWFNISYDTYGNVESYCETDYTYDDSEYDEVDYPIGWLNEIKTTWHYLVSGTWESQVLEQNDYTYDDDGDRLTNEVTDNNGNTHTETYTYDDLDRLSTVDYGDGETQSYTFDAMGNRTQLVDSANGTTTYGYNSANMLTTLNGNASAYTNDNNGNTLTGGGRTNTWDTGNRLIECVDGSNWCQYDYDADGLRRQQSVTDGGTTTVTDYGLDGDSEVREWSVSSGVLTPEATYLIGLQGPEYRRNDVSDTVDWYVYDGLGSVVAEVDPNGNVTAAEKYDAYGALRGSSGSSATRQHFVGNLGHMSDIETGLIYMRARYYDPALGRFVSQDPMQNGNNWYVYVSSNPVNKFDRDGKLEEWLVQQIVEDLGNQISNYSINALRDMTYGEAANWVADTRYQLATGTYLQAEEQEAVDVTEDEMGGEDDPAIETQQAMGALGDAFNIEAISALYSTQLDLQMMANPEGYLLERGLLGSE